MKITHDTDNGLIQASIEGETAVVKYKIENGGLDIYHTFVPVSLKGKGIASELVRYAYDYARESNLQPTATCPYAVAWLKKHPQYEDGSENVKKQ